MRSGRVRPISVLVADDDLLFRRMVSVVLADEKDIAVVGEAADGREAVLRALELLPCVALLDVTMPRGGGVGAARELRRRLPRTGIVMLTASQDDADIYESLKAGANGYVLKQDFVADLAGVIRAANHRLGLLLSPNVANKLLAQVGRDRVRPTTSALSEREVEVLTLMAQGCTNDEVAGRLWLSSHAVEKHIADILAKLKERSRTDGDPH